ncbi:MAG TPA: cytochrome P450, partial [Sphingomicrobium sp.]|nr:cytochrome P450 [Sphingomicrobium sp.]
RSRPNAQTAHLLRDAALLVVSPEAQRDPERLHAAFERLRSYPGLYRVACRGVKPFRAVTRHADVVSVERRSRTFAAAPRTILSSDAVEAELRLLSGKPQIIRGLTHMDEPDHSAYRTVIQPWFTPAALGSLQSRLAEWAASLVDAIGKRAGHCDFAHDLAVPLTLRVITHLLGIPRSDIPRLRKLAGGFAGAEDPKRRLAVSPTDSIHLAMLGFRDYFDSLVADRRARPRGDLSCAIANATVHDKPIPYYEALSNFVLITTAGHDTTAFALTGGLHALIEFTDRLAHLLRNPHLLGSAIEEMLRWTTPVRHFLRTATADAEVGGTRVRAGECLALFFDSANRDETMFPNPGAFEVGRTPIRTWPSGLDRISASGISSRGSRCVRSSVSCFPD